MEHTIFGLIKKRGEIAGQHKVAQKAADALKADLDAIDRALVLCGYANDRFRSHCDKGPIGGVLLLSH